MIYVVGSLKNPQIPAVSKELRKAGYEVFDDWYSAGPNADDHLWDYYKDRGFNAAQALQSPAAKNIFEFDKRHIERADTLVLVMPAGKSAFFELGWGIGKGKKGFILFTEGDPERIDIMFQFATGIVYSVEELLEKLGDS